MIYLDKNHQPPQVGYRHFAYFGLVAILFQVATKSSQTSQASSDYVAGSAFPAFKRYITIRPQAVRS